MPEPMPLNVFFEEAKCLKKELEAAATFETILNLWRNRTLPYRFAHGSPYDEEYKSSVKDIYRTLTEMDYSTANEISSTKQSAEQFETGYPWASQNLGVISNEFIKIAQVLEAIGEMGLGGKRFIEFGTGWANLAMALAKGGQSVTIVDIDEAFLTRARRIAEKENVVLEAKHGDFNEIATGLAHEFDVAIFQASFHHCLDFDRLIDNLRDQTLSQQGTILFFAEPIYKDFLFPWGLRYDGESLWAIMCNKWLELGFDEDFFVGLMFRKGFLLSRITSRPGLMGEGWCAELGPKGLAFAAWEMPAPYRHSFYPPGDGGETFRFCQDVSVLPGLRDCHFKTYRIEFYNFLPRPLQIEVVGSGRPELKTLLPSETWTVEIPSDCESTRIVSDAHAPDELIGNGDKRRLGPAIRSVGLLP